MPGLSGIFRKSRKTKKKIVRVENKNIYGRTYLKAMPLRDLSDLDTVKSEVRDGHILILRITSLATRNIEDVKRAVDELCEFVESIGGDIARLGEERVVICPPNVRIWREKNSIPNRPIPTAV